MKDEDLKDGEACGTPMDIITGMCDKERIAFVEEMGDEKLNALTAKEWAGFASMYLLEASNTFDLSEHKEYNGAVLAKERHMLLKALAITNEAIRRHMSNTGFPSIQTVKLDKAEKKKESPIKIVGRNRGITKG